MELQRRIVRDVTGSALHGTSDGRCVATHTVMYVTCDAPRCVRHGAVCVSHSCVASRSRPTIGADVLPCVPIGAACRPGLFRQARRPAIDAPPRTSRETYRESLSASSDRCTCAGVNTLVGQAADDGRDDGTRRCIRCRNRCRRVDERGPVRPALIWGGACTLRGLRCSALFPTRSGMSFFLAAS